MDTHPEKEYYVLDPRRVSDMVCTGFWSHVLRHDQLIADATKKRTVDGKDINENVAQDVFNEMVQVRLRTPCRSAQLILSDGCTPAKKLYH